MKKLSEKLAPKLLTEGQMEHRVEVCLELKNRVSNYPSCIKSIITGETKHGYMDMIPKPKFHVIAMEDRKFINVVRSGYTSKQRSLFFSIFLV